MKTNWSNRSPAVWMLLVISLVAPLGVGLTVAYYYWQSFGTSFSKEHERWGQFGDLFGGVINPVVGLITIILLVLTLRLQQKELSEQRTEFRRQAFEQTFFTWLNHYSHRVDSFTYLPQGEGVKAKAGVSALHWLLSDAGMAESEAKFLMTPMEGAEKSVPDTQIPYFLEKTRDWWRECFDNEEPQLGALIRTLYTLIRWIDGHEALDPEARWNYVSIVRARLSSPELRILFFNGFLVDGQPFTKLVNRYALLDNLPKAVHSQVILSIEAKTHPFDPSAFDSNAAKSALFE